MTKKTIGRREKISFPEWKISKITGKIDTGAYTSSIHCDHVQEIALLGKKILQFRVLSPLEKKYNGRLIETEHYTQKKVKNSFGQVEVRYKVTTKVIMFGEEFEAEFTLTDRSKMRTPILLGRKIISGRFIVDVQEVNLSQKTSK